MLLSIVIPVYNCSPFLDRCIRSILDQNAGEEIEIIAIDDGSTDQSGAILDGYAEEHGNVRVFHKENGGVTSARILGCEKATGDFILCVDADDALAPESLPVFLRILKEKNPDLLCFAFRNGTGVCKNNVAEGLYTGAALDDVRDRYVSANNYYVTLSYNVWSKIVRRDLFTRHQCAVPKTLTIGEDFYVCYQILRDVKTLYVSDTVGYLYIDNPTSVSRTFKEEKFYRLNELIKNFAETAKESETVNLAFSLLLALVLTAAQESPSYREFRGIVRRSKQYETLWSYALRQTCVFHTPKERIKYFALKHGLLRVLYVFVSRK